MTMLRMFAAWRHPIIDLWVPAGTKHRIVFLAKGPEFSLGADHFTWPLDLDDFVTGQSDYDMSDDEVYCPCGVVLHDVGSSAGEILRAIYRHCGAAGHPRPAFDR